MILHQQFLLNVTYLVPRGFVHHLHVLNVAPEECSLVFDGFL